MLLTRRESVFNISAGSRLKRFERHFLETIPSFSLYGSLEAKLEIGNVKGKLHWESEENDRLALKAHVAPKVLEAYEYVGSYKKHSYLFLISAPLAASFLLRAGPKNGVRRSQPYLARKYHVGIADSKGSKVAEYTKLAKKN